jgi:hypothetical protein
MASVADPRVSTSPQPSVLRSSPHRDCHSSRAQPNSLSDGKMRRINCVSPNKPFALISAGHWNALLVGFVADMAVLERRRRMRRSDGAGNGFAKYDCRNCCAPRVLTCRDNLPAASTSIGLISRSLFVRSHPTRRLPKPELSSTNRATREQKSYPQSRPAEGARCCGFK